jgi:hypothetical protein
MTKSLTVIASEDREVVRKTTIGVDQTPADCPVCHISILPYDRGLAWQIKDESRVEQVLQCPSEECQHFFVARYVRVEVGYKLDCCVPLEPFTAPQSATISKISSDFCAIFAEADKAEQYGLLLVAGPGYRKALEFLVKDYIISESAETGKELAAKKAVVEKTQLGTCIANYIKNDQIREIAKRATWLGNDETHYVRKWEDKDLKDLKKLISLTLHWIEMEKLTAEVMVDMPHRKP